MRRKHFGAVCVWARHVSPDWKGSTGGELALPASTTGQTGFTWPMKTDMKEGHISSYHHCQRFIDATNYSLH